MEPTELPAFLEAMAELDFPVVVVDEQGTVRVVSGTAASTFAALRGCQEGDPFPAYMTETPADFATWLEEARQIKAFRISKDPRVTPTPVLVKAQPLGVHGGGAALWVLNLHQAGSLSRVKYEREILLRISSVPIPELVREGMPLNPEQPLGNPLTRELLGQVAKYLHSECALFFQIDENRALQLVGEFGLPPGGVEAAAGSLEKEPKNGAPGQGVLRTAALTGFPSAFGEKEFSDPQVAELAGLVDFPCQGVWVDGISGVGAVIAFFRHPPNGELRQFATDAFVRLGRHLESAAYSSHMYEAFLELRQTQEQVIQAGKMAAIGELATGMAHELRQPVTVINNFFSTILDQLEAGQFEKIRERLGEYRERARRNIERLTGIIDHLRVFGRQGRNDFQPVEVKPFIEDVFHTFLDAQLKRHNIRVNLDIPEDFPPVEMDVARIEQVILNLVFNARDAVEKQPDPVITITVGQVDGAACISVADNGVGIPQENVEKVLDPFFTTKPVGKGTGLGLSISHGIVEAHNGRLEVKNNPEGGVISTLTIPLHQPAAAERPEA